MRVLVLGAGGMLGRDLVATAPADITLFPLARADLDITSGRTVASRVAELQPDVIINAAAYTAVDNAESEPERAFRVNAEAVGELGRVAAKVRVRVVHFSTDYVFDGRRDLEYTEEDTPNPLNVYGASKLAGERALLASGAQVLVIRSQWLFGLHGRSFPRTMLQRALRSLATSVVNDQFGRPTFTGDVARASWRIMTEGHTGVYHVAGSGVASWYDVASEVFSYAHRANLLAACKTSDYPTPALRPRFSALSTNKTTRELGITFPTWRESLACVLPALVSQEEWQPK